MFEAQVDADSQKAVGTFIGGLLEKAFVGVTNGLTSLNSGVDDQLESDFTGNLLTPEFEDF